MEDICIEFAEWVGINTFDYRYARMRHEINSRGFHRWALDDHYDYIMTNNLYEKFCDSKGIEFTIPQRMLYWDKKFEPTNFVEFIGNKKIFYYRWTYKGIQQDPYWTDYKFKNKYTTNELWKLFK